MLKISCVTSKPPSFLFLYCILSVELGRVSLMRWFLFFFFNVYPTKRKIIRSQMIPGNWKKRRSNLKHKCWRNYSLKDKLSLMFLASPKTDALARCSEEKQQKHVNVYKMKEGCCRNQRAGLCRRAWKTLLFGRRTCLEQGMLQFPHCRTKQGRVLLININAARKYLSTSEHKDWPTAPRKFKTKW